MSEAIVEVLEYLTTDGRNPFREWLEALKDREARARVQCVSTGFAWQLWRQQVGWQWHQRVADSIWPRIPRLLRQARRYDRPLLCGGTSVHNRRDIERLKIAGKTICGGRNEHNNGTV